MIKRLYWPGPSRKRGFASKEDQVLIFDLLLKANQKKKFRKYFVTFFTG
jgi:hypothetical protein